MKSIEKMNSMKSKSRFAPVVATIGRFSSAFRRFEMKEERRHSEDITDRGSEVKARHATLGASLSVGSDKKPTSTKETPVGSSHAVKKLPRSPYHASSPQAQEVSPVVATSKQNDQQTEQEKHKRLSRTSTITSSTPSSAAKPRSANIPVESSRMIRSVRESTNAPDVVPAALQKGQEETTPDEEPVQQFELTTESQSAMTFEAVSLCVSA